MTKKDANTSPHFDVLCIDFDETLFNHWKLNEWVDSELAHDGFITEGEYMKGMDAYHESLTPILRLYKHEQHFKDVTGKDWSYIAGHLKKKLSGAKCQFCYQDSHDFVKWAVANVPDVRIVSFGHGEYQRFKMGLCDELRRLDLPIHIVDRPKAEFLADYFADVEHGALADDKYPLFLPGNFMHILVDRSGKYTVHPSDRHRVNYVRSLDHYREQLRNT